MNPANVHWHFFAQVSSALKPHSSSSLLPTTAAGRYVHPGRYPVSSLVHPKYSGLGAAMTGFRLFLQILAWYKRWFAC